MRQAHREALTASLRATVKSVIAEHSKAAAEKADLIHLETGRLRGEVAKVMERLDSLTAGNAGAEALRGEIVRLRDEKETLAAENEALRDQAAHLQARADELEDNLAVARALAPADPPAPPASEAGNGTAPAATQSPVIKPARTSRARTAAAKGSGTP